MAEAMPLTKHALSIFNIFTGGTHFNIFLSRLAGEA
jgi:hypothetical protein